jgi:cystathionine gamma-synthase
VQTLLSDPPSSSHRGLTEEARQALGICQGFLRVSVGVEEIGELIGMFERGVAAAAEG